MGKSQKKLYFCKKEDWICCAGKGFIPVGDKLVHDLDKSRSAFLILPVIDSGQYGFIWERLKIEGYFPDDSVVSVYAKAWNAEGLEKFSDNEDMNGSDEKIRKDFNLFLGSPISRSTDSILNLEGEKLLIALEISAGGEEAPEVNEIAVTVESDHMTDYLPAIYRKDDFTRRFLSIFNSMFLDMEKRIGDIPEIFDINSKRTEVIKLLSYWLAIPGMSIDEGKMGELIKTAFFDHEDKYTKKGLMRSIKLLTGKDSIIIEHFEVNPHSGECSDPQVFERLYGDDPYTFFVLLPEDTFKNTDEKESFIRDMKHFIPAGRRMELILLKQGIQLDWHSYLGVNSMVGDYTSVKIDENSSLQFDTIIGGSRQC